MNADDDTAQRCVVCSREYSTQDLVPAPAVREAVGALIVADHPEWSPRCYICRADMAKYQARYVASLLEAERGELTALDDEVVRSLRDQEVLARNVDAEFDQRWTAGERLADRIARFGGSWTFLMLFGGFLAVWITVNSLVFLWRPADPYPFILLNLVLSCLAAIQAPIIMMSQNRQEAKDRVRSQHDYQVNLKAELEIRRLHDKMDHLLWHQWERLAKIQEVQLDLLSEIERKQTEPAAQKECLPPAAPPNG